MKKLLSILIIFMCMTVLFAAGKTKLEFDTVDLKQNPVSTEDYKNNKLTMINIWGTFCPPCIREMPELGALNKANKDKGVEVVGLVVDLVNQMGVVDSRALNNARQIIAKTGADYTHIVPNQKMLRGFLRQVQVVPTTIFINSKGEIVRTEIGARSQEVWQNIIDSILSKNE